MARAARAHVHLLTRFGAARYSFSNQILLWMQRGDVSSVATFHAWQKTGRTVQKGEKALYILQPRPVRLRGKKPAEQEETEGKIPVDFVTVRPLAVFDVTQTEGAPLPPPPKLTEEIVDPEPFASAVEVLRDVVRGLPGSPFPLVRSSGERIHAAARTMLEALGMIPSVTPSQEAAA